MLRRELHVAPDGDVFSAHMPGHPFVGAGNTEMDAIQEVLNNVPNLLIQNVEIDRMSGPLLKGDRLIEARDSIEIRQNSSMAMVANLFPNICITTGPSELDALDELLTLSPHVLRRAHLLDIHLHGRVTGKRYQIVMYLNEYRGYTATLEPDASANEGDTAHEALMSLLTTVPHVFRFGRKITVQVLRDMHVTDEEDMAWGL